MNSTVNQMYTPLCHGGKIHIENEVILPDHCADIQRVVKADITPKITSRNVYGDDDGLNVSLDGTALFKIIYLCEGSDRLHSTFFTEVFSHSFKVQGDAASDFDGAFVHISLAVENVSCRPSASGRINLRGDLSVIPEIRLNRKIDYFCADNPSFEVISEKYKLCSMCAHSESDYNISEKITLPSQLPCAEEILDCDIRYICDSLKVTDGKAIFNATALFTCFYSSGEGNVSFCQPFELSQIIDIPSGDGACDGEIRFTPTSLRADVDVDNYGENRVISLDFSYTAHVVCFCNNEFDAVCDIFSPEKDIAAQYGDFSIRTLKRTLSEKIPVSASLKLKNPETVSIEDIRPAASVRGWVIENGMLSLDGRIKLRMIGMFPGGSEGLEENVDFSVQIPTDDAPIQQCDVNVYVREVDCVIAGNSIEVRADISLNGCIFEQTAVHCVKEVSEGEAKKSACRPPVILYYPCEDETLWDIAKKYSLSRRSIMEFNGMDKEKITEKVLKIPMK